MTKPQGYSRLQIALHWVVAALIVMQVLLSDGIKDAYRDILRGAAISPNFLIAAHVIGGGLVLIFALWRLILRARRGVPAPIAGQSKGQILAAEAVHYALYALLIVVPLSGMAAWFGGIEPAGDAHEALKTLLVLLVLAHVAAALYHQFIRKDGLLKRMWRGA